MAHWLGQEGFGRLSVLTGGLAAWRAAGGSLEALQQRTDAPAGADEAERTAVAVPRAESFLPSLATRYLADGDLPSRRRLTTLFVDIAGSTRLLEHHSVDAVLALVQRFMRLVTDVALAYCGDVKDFEGDGALLYFESAEEATQAALAIRDALASGVCGTGCPVSARMSVTTGEVVVGLVGTVLRRSIALIGPSVHVGARLLKHIEPGGIIASADVVDTLRAQRSPLAEEFQLRDQAFRIPGADDITVMTYAIGPSGRPDVDTGGADRTIRHGAGTGTRSASP